MKDLFKWNDITFWEDFLLMFDYVKWGLSQMASENWSFFLIKLALVFSGCHNYENFDIWVKSIQN